VRITGGRVARFLDAPPDNLIGVLFFGPDRGLVKERAQAIISKWSNNPDDAFSSTVLTSDDLQSDPAKLAGEMVTLSIFGNTHLVRLRLDHERPGATISKLIREFDSRPETVAANLVIEAGDMTPRSAIRKAFEAAVHFAAIGCYPDTLSDIANLIRQELNAVNISIKPNALNLWVPRLEGDRAMARSEIEKMISYKGAGLESGAVVTPEDIRIASAGALAGSLDDIVLSVMSGRVQDADSLIQRAFMTKIQSAIILRALQRHIQKLLEAKTLVSSGQTARGAMKSLRPPVFPMQERMFLAQLNRWPERALAQVLSRSLEVEQRMKSAGAPAESLLGQLATKLSEYASRKL